MATRVWRRMIDTMQTLNDMVSMRRRNGDGTRENQHGAKSEDNNQRLFLPAGDIKTAKHSDGHGEDDEVLNDVDGAIREPHNASIQAHSVRNRLVPEEGNRSTNENTAKERPDTPHRHDTDGDMAGKSEARVWKNRQVLHQDGQLGQGQGQVVDPDASPECLQRLQSAIVNIHNGYDDE